jgi:hypothetical protein
MKKNALSIPCFFIVFIVISFSIKAQEQQKDSLFIRQVPVNKSQRTKDTVSKVFNKTLITKANKPSNIAPYTVIDNNDIRIWPSAHVQAEVHISISKSNPNVLLASANTYTTTYNQGYYYSTNGGNSWSGADVLQNSPATVNGDPSTAIANDGRMYISSLNPNGGYFLQNSTNNGQTFSALTTSAGTETNFDKEMIAADNQTGSPYVNNVYCAWTNFTTNPTHVEFNRTTDHGTTFSAPVILKNGFGQGTNVQTGPSGEVYVCWADYDAGKTNASGLGFSSSLNGGVNFSAYSRVFTYNGIRTTNGPNATFNNIGVNDFPSMAVDKSNLTFRGRIYVTFPEFDANGHAIIRVRSSSDKGQTWTAPVTVSISNATQSFFPWIAVDDCTGDIVVVYYAFDNSSSAFSTNTYVAHSSNGGVSWENQKVSDVSHITAPINNNIFRTGYAGDYIGIAAYGGRAFPAWMDNRNGTWQVYVSPITLLSSPAPVINGEAYVCTTSNPYSITNLPSGSTVSWSVSPSGIANLSCTNCTQPTLSKVSSGNISLSASINTACGTHLLTISKNISVGVPNNYYIQSMSYNNPRLDIYPSFTGSQQLVTSWSVYVDGSFSTSGSGYPPSVISVYANCGSHNITLTTYNSCGSYSTSSYYTASGCYALTPNPARGNVTVTDLAANNMSASTGGKTLASIGGKVTITVFDNTNRPLKQFTFSQSRRYSFSVAGLTPGVYTVQIKQNGSISSLKLIKE